MTYTYVYAACARSKWNYVIYVPCANCAINPKRTFRYFEKATPPCPRVAWQHLWLLLFRVLYGNWVNSAQLSNFPSAHMLQHIPHNRFKDGVTKYNISKMFAHSRSLLCAPFSGILVVRIYLRHISHVMYYRFGGGKGAGD